jgi:hypothetical protein
VSGTRIASSTPPIAPSADVDADECGAARVLEHGTDRHADRGEVEDDVEDDEQRQHEAGDDDVIGGYDDRAEHVGVLRIGTRHVQHVPAPFETLDAAEGVADGEGHHGERKVRAVHDWL